MNDHREIPVTVRTTTTGLHNYNNTTNTNNIPYVYISPVPPSSAAANRPNPICEALTHCSRKVEEATRQAELMVDNLWNHLRVGTSPADAAMARLVQGTKLLAKGGTDKLFQQTFGVFGGEKVLKSYVCYISTTSGPVIGTLYITTKRLAFCSDYPLCHHPFYQHHQCLYYKVIVQLDQLRTVNPYTNRLNPKEKSVQVVTVDGYEFLFLGFMSYDKALKTLNEALEQYGNQSRANASVQ